jgi:hypothetical protein
MRLRCVGPSQGSAHRSAASRRGRAILRYTDTLAPMAKLVDATDLKQLSGSRGNALPDPVKVGEPLGYPEATPSQSGLRRAAGRCREWTAGT